MKSVSLIKSIFILPIRTGLAFIPRVEVGWRNLVDFSQMITCAPDFLISQSVTDRAIELEFEQVERVYYIVTWTCLAHIWPRSPER